MGDNWTNTLEVGDEVWYRWNELPRFCNTPWRRETVKAVYKTRVKLASGINFYRADGREWGVPKGRREAGQWAQMYPLNLWLIAHKRVRESEALSAHYELISYPWENWDEHCQWLIEASESEIVDWAMTVEGTEVWRIR